MLPPRSAEREIVRWCIWLVDAADHSVLGVQLRLAAGTRQNRKHITGLVEISFMGICLSFHQSYVAGQEHFSANFLGRKLGSQPNYRMQLAMERDSKEKCIAVCIVIASAKSQKPNAEAGLYTYKSELWRCLLCAVSLWMCSGFQSRSKGTRSLIWNLFCKTEVASKKAVIGLKRGDSGHPCFFGGGGLVVLKPEGLDSARRKFPWTYL